MYIDYFTINWKKKKRSAILLGTPLPLGTHGHSHPAHTIPSLTAQWMKLFLAGVDVLSG